MRHCPKVLELKFKAGIKRPDMANAIDAYIRNAQDECEDLFEINPSPITSKERAEWMSHLSGVSLSSDAFFPFKGFSFISSLSSNIHEDNVIRASKSGVIAICAPQGSVMDSVVVHEAESRGIQYIFAKDRMFHH